MGAVDIGSASQQAENSVTEASDFEPVPEQRKKRARCISVIICTITAILVITFCVVKRTVVEYYPNSTQKNSTNVFYIKKEKLGFPGLFTTAMGLFGVVLGTLVDRLSLVNEERYHLKRRYGGSWRKMIKACFSGIKWGPVIALLASTAVTVLVLILTTNKPWFELNYLVIIFSGIGVGPLIMHLLNLNTQSEVHISTILEEKGMYIANGLAWSYYFNYLKQALPKFKETAHQNIELTSKKLLLLIPHDCYTVDDLSELDTKIRKLPDAGQDPFRFPVYCLTDSQDKEYHYAIQYIKEPLKTLWEMSNFEGVKAVKRQTREEEIRLLCRTMTEILHDPPDQDCRETCMLVPIRAENLESLKDGGLAKCIMDIIRTGSTQPDGAPVFVKPAKEQRVNIPEPTKSVDKNAKTAKNQRYSCPTYNDKHTEQDHASNNQDDDSSKKKEKIKEKKLKRNYKNKTSNNPERQKMISAEHSDTDDKNKTKQAEEKRYTQEEVGDKNDSGASTSGTTSEMTGTDTKRQSDQHDVHSSNHDKTEL